MVASTSSGEEGRQSGALIEVFRKYGTNKFHAVLSEFQTDSGFTARTEFQTRVPKTVRNDFGGALGSPIFKDKTFFFGSLFYQRSVLGNTLIRDVETAVLANYNQANFPLSVVAQLLKQASPQNVPTYNLRTVTQLQSAYGTAYMYPAI